MNYKKMISRVKKNKPSFNGKFMSLPPLARATTPDSAAIKKTNEDKIETKEETISPNEA